MAIPQVHANLSTEDVADIMTNLDSVYERLEFLTGLTANERREIPKIGRKFQSFVAHSLDMAEERPDLMPGCLNVEQARQDVELFEALNPILQKLNHLRKLVLDTQTIVGSEAYAAARLAYTSAKATGKGQGIDDTLHDLSRHFQKTRRSSPSKPAGDGT